MALDVATASTTPPPPVTAPAQRADTPVSTKITMTDYGYVVGELKRIGLLTLLIFAILAGLWPLLSR
ncbi:MAG: hypothetical protein U0531_07520 [Dehalococcoidia bacterium]